MSFLDIFSSSTPAPEAAPVAAPVAAVPGQLTPAPGQPGNIAPLTGVAPDGQVAAVPAAIVPVETQVPDSPLDPFKTLWEDVPIDPNAPVETAPVELTAEAVQKVMEGANFVPQITDDQRAAIVAGGEGAQEAFNAALNSVAQQVMTQATLVGNKLSERQIQVAIDKHMATIPELLRKQGSTEHLRTTNPIFENPAVKPIIDATQAQLLQKFPQASHAEITKMTQDFILAMGESFAPPTETLVPGETDWGSFLKQ